MVAEVQRFFDDLNLESLRVARPSKFMFLCGGAIKAAGPGKPSNLRDYLCRVRPLRLKHPVVLAEEAVQLYRDTEYHDLISFEEDIARIAAVVLVIAESAGSLAELGAFSSNATISKALRVVIQEEHERAESFVRFGPVERVKRAKRENLGVYPWRTRGGDLVIGSTKPHYTEIKNFIAGHIEATALTTSYGQLGESRLFYVIYWVLFVCLAISFTALMRYVNLIDPAATQADIRNKLFCMRLAKWVGKESYSSQDYYYSALDVDPFEYSFKPGVADKDRTRRKLEVFKAHLAAERIPLHVRKVATRARGIRGP